MYLLPEKIISFPTAQPAYLKSTVALLLFFTGMLLISGCVSQEKMLKPGQSLLYKQQIKGNEKTTTNDLEPFYLQKPNRRWLKLPIFPYVVIYRLGLQNYEQSKVENEITQVREKYNQKIQNAGSDSVKVARIEKKREKKINRLNRKLTEGNWLMRAGEPPVAFDSLLARKSAMQMQEYLESKGFFRGTVKYEYHIDTLRRARVVYQVTENARSVIRNVSWQTDQPGIDSLLRVEQNRSLIRTGEGYDAEKLTAERDRIDKLLKNNGYYNFNRQYIAFAVNDTISSRQSDSTIRQPQLDIQTIINNPPDGSVHRVLTVKDVYFTEDAGSRSRQRRDTLLFQRIYYLSREHRFSRKILNSKILIRPDTRYSLQKSLDTQRLLSSLDIFKFANIFYDSTGRTFAAKIYTSPLDKYSYSVEAGGTVTLANGYPGPFGSANFKVRNVFGGLEVFELRVTGGVEGVAGFINESSRGGILSSQQLSLTGTLIFPQMLIPGRLKYFFSSYTPQTRVSVGYNFTGRPDFRRFGFRGTLSYLWQPASEKQFNVTLLEINRIFSEYTNNQLGDTLRNQIEVVLKSQGSTLWRAFQRAFVSSSNISYTYNGNITNQRRKAQYWRLYAESGGLLMNLPGLNRAGIQQGDSTQDGLQFFRFLKFNADYRFYLPRGRQSMWAFRINLGFANPYGPAGTLPYEKFFFAGGSNSVRAWFPRTLGLGSSPASINDNGNYTYRFEQPGDILLEASAEYRNNFLKFSSFNIQSAFFVDAGNVWLLRPDKSVPNGDFALSRFYREIAVGTGIGLRFDFSFLLIRFDLGTKVYDPGRQPQDRWAIMNIFRRRSVFTPGQSTLNFGIGYPF